MLYPGGGLGVGESMNRLVLYSWDVLGIWEAMN